MQRFAVTLLLILLATSSQAETRYVTDYISFSLREAPNKGAKFLTGLPSGTRVDILDTQPGTGYSKVKTRDGRVGFIETRRLQKQPPARLLLEEADKKIVELQRSGSGRGDNGLMDDYEVLKFEHAKLKEDYSRLQKKMEAIQRTSANAVRISMERNDLRKQLADMTRSKAELEQKHLEAGNNREQRWFIIGSGVLFAGIILGLLLPNLRFKREKRYPDL